MTARAILGLAVALAAVACTTGEADDPPPSTTLVAETTSTTIPPAAAVDAGRLAILDFDGNVAVIDPDGSDLETITTDAGDAVYGQPIWSPDSSMLSYSRIGDEGFSVHIDSPQGDSLGVVTMPANPFYMSWAPDGESIGVLHNGTQGLDFEIVDVAGATSAVVDQGQPYYFSWSPDGEQVAIHEGADRFEAVDLAGGRSPLGETDAGYLVPQWLDRGVLHVSDGLLVIDDGDDPIELAGVTGDQTFFVANARGTRVAVQSLGGGMAVALEDTPTVEPNTVTVVDAATGELEVVDRGAAIGFWWSPDGESLLVLSAAPGRGQVVPKVWAPGEPVTEYPAYEPSPLQVRELFPFFPQYAQSMTFWAPDSSGFALAGEIGSEAGVWVQALDADSPRRVAVGAWVAFSR